MNNQRNRSRAEVSVIIPAHNEEENVQPLLEQFVELNRKARFSLEVIMVDDGSTDRTLPRIVDMQQKYSFVHIVSLPTRRGLTEALQAGFSVANGQILVFYPADRQFHPNDIPRMVDKVHEGYDLVTGRKIGEYNKRVVSGVYNRISRMLFPSIPVTDLNSVKAFRKELVDVFDYRHDWHRFWVAIVAEAGYRVGEVDVTLYQRTKGRSKFGIWRIPSGVLDLLAVKFQYHTMRRPLWYFGLIGSALLLAAFVIGLWALYERFVLEQGYRPLLYLVMTLGIAGTVFFTLGFLAESVAGIRQRLDTIKGPPRRNFYKPPTQSRSRPDSSRERPSRNGQSTGSSRSRNDRPEGRPSRERPGRGDRSPRQRGQSDNRRRTRERPSSSSPAKEAEKDSAPPKLKDQATPAQSVSRTSEPREVRNIKPVERTVVRSVPESKPEPRDSQTPATPPSNAVGGEQPTRSRDASDHPQGPEFGRRNRR